MHHRYWLIVSCILQLYPQQSDLLVSSLSCRSACRLSSQFHLYSTLQLSACAQCNRPMTLTMTCLTLAQEKASIITLCHPTMLPKFAEQQSTKKDLRDAEMDTLTKSCSPTKVITANGEVQTHEEATIYVKELFFSWLWKSSKTPPAVLSLGKLCDENGYSYEWINCRKPHLIKNGIRIPCNTENFVPIVVPGLSSSSSGSSSTSRTPSRQESNCSSSSSSSSSSPTVSEIQTRERGDQTESDISPVHVPTTVDDRSGRPDDNQANKNPKTNKKESKREQSDPLCSERENLVDDRVLNAETHTSVHLMNPL